MALVMYCTSTPNSFAGNFANGSSVSRSRIWTSSGSTTSLLIDVGQTDGSYMLNYIAERKVPAMPGKE